METEANPYRPPGSEVISASDEGPLHGGVAGKGRRFGTFAVDYIGVMGLGLVVGLLIGVLFGEAGFAVMEGVPDLVFGVALFFVYYAFFEGLWSRTPGKWLFGTMVVREDGGEPSFGQVLGRTASRLIPFEAFTFLGSSGVGFHDSIPGTRVVRVLRRS